MPMSTHLCHLFKSNNATTTATVTDSTISKQPFLD
jgi:hypothetical protein